MDKQTEQRIRERAYELWMQHGSLAGRADEYWYQAEQEILGHRSEGAEGRSHAVVGSDEAVPDEAALDEAGAVSSSDEAEAPVETAPAPLGMTSQTLDEVLSSPAAPKTRKRRSTAVAAVETAAEVNEASGETVAAPKRRRPRKSSL